MQHEPGVTAATLLNFVVRDMLHQSDFNYAHLPELVDLAVIGTGLGMIRANVPLVNNKGTYWDTTQWLAVPKPFLDAQSFAYATAIAAWSRDDKDPAWANDLPAEVKGPMKKSLKYLNKTNDSFFQPKSATTEVLNQPEADWWKLAESKSLSTKVVAMNRLQLEGPVTQTQENLLLDQLRSNNRAVLLHTIGAVDQMKDVNHPVVDELRLLAEHRDNEVRAKAMCSLTKLAQLDEATMRLAANMLDSKVRFVNFAGISALASKESIPGTIMPAIDRGFVQSLQNCDYEFVGLYAAAYQRWTDDPKAHFEALLEHDSPEFLEMATDVLQSVQESLIALE